MSKRLISLFLTFAMLFSLCGVGCKEIFSENTETVFNPVNETVSLTPLYADDDDLLFENPDRGFRTEFYIMLKKTRGNEKYDTRTVFVDESEEQIRATIQYIFDIYIYSKPMKCKISLAYIYLTDWRREELTDDVFRFLDIYFQMCREQGIKNCLRFAYCDSHEALDRNADEQTIVRHTKQLKDIVGKNSDTIHTIEAGFVGSYGEWATVYQQPPVDYATVIKAIVENICVPNNLYFSIQIETKNNVGQDYEYYWAIGHNRDSMIGYHNRGLRPGSEYGTPMWLQLEKEAAYTPNGGEMHTNYALMSNNTIPTGMEMLMNCYYWRQNTFSGWHGYLEAYWQDNVMQRWMDNETITPEKLDAKGIIYDPAWFLDENGKTVERNPFEFIRDYLGYKVVAQEINLNWSGSPSDKMQINMTLINYGFSAAFCMTSGFAILDSEGNVISEVEAGEPGKWYNRDPDDAYSRDILTHEIRAELDPPAESGTYKLAFYLRNTMKQYANLSNTCDNVNGYNILSEFTV